MQSRASDQPLASHRDLLCFSHLRWEWVFQRPQHLLTRAARDRRVFFIEEPVHTDADAFMERSSPVPNVVVLRPRFAGGVDAHDAVPMQRKLLDRWMTEETVMPDTLWFYTPMALPFASHLSARVRVYDCMDELSGFAGAPAALRLLEKQLLGLCDVVFTGGHSIYELKSQFHTNCHAVPSSVDTHHFAKARMNDCEPEDQRAIPGPILGYCGVLDERLDLDLIAAVADARPDWQLVFIGPVCKIDESSLPRRTNVHYLGARRYDQLPSYLSGWDVGMLPFAINDATRFISPTKTPEYLAAGLHAVSTPVRDVVRGWGNDGLVRIAATASEFVIAVQECLGDTDTTRLSRVDRVLAQNSWDATWQRMQDIMTKTAAAAA